MNQYLQSALIENTYLFALLTLVITLYGPRLAPELPVSIKQLFNSVVFRTLLIFLLVFMAKKNIKVSIVVSVIFLVIQGMIDKDNALLALFYKQNNNIAENEQMDEAVHQQVTGGIVESFFDGPNNSDGNWSTQNYSTEHFVGNNVVDETTPSDQNAPSDENIHVPVTPNPLPGLDVGLYSDDNVNVQSDQNIKMNVTDNSTLSNNKEARFNKIRSTHLENGNVRNDPYPNGPPVCDCNVYPANNIQLTGTAFYPMSDNNTLQNMNLDSIDYSQQFNNDQFSPSCLKTLSNTPS